MMIESAQGMTIALVRPYVEAGLSYRVLGAGRSPNPGGAP